MTLGKRSRKRHNRKRDKQRGLRLRAESLEPRIVLTNASLDVLRIGNDLVVQGFGDGGKDEIFLTSSFEGFGFVQVKMDVQEEIFGQFPDDDDSTITITQTFSSPNLEAAAANQGGRFLGYQLFGQNGDDTIDASDLRNLENTVLDGGSGDDSLIGGAKTRDSFFGGPGTDVITDADYLDGTIDGGTAPPKGPGNTLTFKGPNPIKFVNTTFSTIKGTDLSGKIGDKVFEGDTIDSSGFEPFRVNDKGEFLNAGVTVDGLLGNDTIIGSKGNDSLVGGAGDDTLSGLAGDDDLDGGDGKDNLDGGDGKDNLDGGGGDDALVGGGGDDTLSGGGGKDNLSGGAGKDNLFGEDGDDTLNGGPGDDNLDGGAGSDTVDYSGAGKVDVNLGNEKADDDGFGNKDTLISIENINGSGEADKIIGNDDKNVLKGGGGDDTIEGRGGDDTIEGGDGNDNLMGQTGDDTIDGGAGKDTILGNSGNDVIFGGKGDDTINGDEQDEGVTGNDVIHGGEGNDTIRGWNGDDLIHGDEGDDLLFGGFGDDILAGGMGEDTLDGGRGNDAFEGGFNELATDKLFFEYNPDTLSIVDVQISGGFAFQDEFIALTHFDDKGDEPDPDNDKDKDFVNTGDGIPDNQPFNKQKNTFSPQDRLRIRDQLLNGGGNLLFSDYDGGDGQFGDRLSFGESQLP